MIGSWRGLALGNTIEGSALDDGTTVAVLTWKAGFPQDQYSVNVGTLFHFMHGHFSARFKSPDTSSQPNIGLTTSFYLYGTHGKDIDGDGMRDTSRMTYEFVNAAPEYVLMTTQSGRGTTDHPTDSNYLDLMTRQIQMKEGRIDHTQIKTLFGGVLNQTNIEQNDNIDAYPDFSIRDFHVFGMDWYKKRAVYWVENDEGKKINLWEHDQKVPQLPMQMFGSMWWANESSLAESPDAVEKPNFNPIFLFDWIKYEPLEEGIDDYGNPISSSDLNQDQSPNGNTVVIVVPIVVAVVVIAIVVAAIFIIRARNKQKEESAEVAV